MPELPEVETVRRSLEPVLVGARIESVLVRCPRLRRPVPDDFATALEGRRIVAARRRAKYLIFDLDDGRAWIVHLGMSGRLFFKRPPLDPPAKHDHVILDLEAGGRVTFQDPRRFGLVAVDDPADFSLFARLGPEPLDASAFDGAYLCALRAKTIRTVKDVLMDQRVVAGLGNIYVNEALFACGIRPRRRLSRLTRAQCDALVASCRAVLKDAIEHRGSTVSDFLDGIGRRGGYQWKHNVYDREGKPCTRCGAPIKSVVIAQRSSFYCPRCQC